MIISENPARCVVGPTTPVRSWMRIRSFLASMPPIVSGVVMCIVCVPPVLMVRSKRGVRQIPTALRQISGYVNIRLTCM